MYDRTQRDKLIFFTVQNTCNDGMMVIITQLCLVGIYTIVSGRSLLAVDTVQAHQFTDKYKRKVVLYLLLSLIL